MAIKEHLLRKLLPAPKTLQKYFSEDRTSNILDTEPDRKPLLRSGHQL